MQPSGVVELHNGEHSVRPICFISIVQVTAQRPRQTSTRSDGPDGAVEHFRLCYTIDTSWTMGIHIPL